MLLGLSSVARAQIVALGASNTYGTGVPRGADYPAQLEALLDARGLKLHVTNAGIRGETVAQMLSHLDTSVPSDTRVVLFQPGANDTLGGADPFTVRKNIQSVVRQLRERGIPVVVLQNEDFDRIPADMRQSDHIHLTAAGYKRLAEELLPRVLSVLEDPQSGLRRRGAPR